MSIRRYAILRVEKRHDFGQIGRSQAHNLRTGKRPYNVLPGGPAPTLMFGSNDVHAELTRMLPTKRRSNAVIAVETLLTASPEWFKSASPSDYESWKNANVAFCQQLFGDNLVQVILHEDEASPHFHVYWCPMLGGRLNYRGILGAPSQLVELQDRYARAMEPFGLNRGISGSKRRHEKSISVVEKVNRLELGVNTALKAIKTASKAVTNVGVLEPLMIAVRALSGALRTPVTPLYESRRSEQSEGPKGPSGVEAAVTVITKLPAPRAPF